MSLLSFLLHLVSRWYVWLGLILAVLVVVAITAYYSDDDLKNVDAQARAQGMSLEWSELKIPTPDPVRLAHWEKALACIGGDLEAFCSDTNYHRPFTPVSATMMEWYANQNQAKRELMWSELDQMGDGPLWVGGEPRNLYLEGYPTISSIRHFCLILSEQSIAIPKAQLSALHCRMLRLVRSIKFPCSMGKLVSNSCCQRVLTAIAERIPDLKGSEELIAGELDRLVQSLEQDLEAVWQEDFVLSRRAIHKRESDIISTHRDSFVEKVLFPLVFRLERAQILRRIIALDEDRRSLPLWTDRIQAYRMKESNLRAQMNSWNYLLKLRAKYGSSFWGTYPIVIQQNVSVTLYAKLLAAELRKQAWPIDTFDPAGAPLRPLLRDGMLIGAYSVGLNGIDDKGVKGQDIPFLLYGPLFVPKPVP